MKLLKKLKALIQKDPWTPERMKQVQAIFRASLQGPSATINVRTCRILGHVPER